MIPSDLPVYNSAASQLNNSVEEGSVLQQKPLHNLAKGLIKVIDKFFKEGSPQLEDAKFHGYKKGGWIMGDYISDWGGNATMFLIFPSAQFNPDVKSDEQSADYASKSGGYFTSIDQGKNVGVMGKIVLHLDMYIPILSDYKPDVIPSSEYDIRDPKVRKKIYKQFKRELYQFAYHEAQHAVKKFVYGWEGKPGLGVKYQKYYDQPASKRGLTAYAGIGDERESILAQIASEVESTIKFDKDRPQQLQTLTSTLIVSPSFRRLVIGMLDSDTIIKDAPANKEFFRSFWANGKPKFLIDKFDPFNPNFFKYINPKYHRLYKMVMKKLVQWWRSKFPRRTFRTPLEEYYIPGYTGTSGKSNFSEPENFDSYDEGSGWVAYRGGNDWENGTTACAVYFDNGREMARIWFNVKVPEGTKSDSDCSEGERDAYNDWGEKASKTWIREAKKIHKVPREYFSDGKPWYKEWKECFIEALNSEEMEPYVKECGVDQTKWAEMKKESIEENGGSGMFSGNGRTASPSNLDVDRFVDDTSDKLDDFLNEEMTYKDLYLTSDPARIKRADTVRSRSLRVRSIDEYEAWTFSYKSNPSNSRKTKTGISPRWQGYVKFLKEDVRAGEDAQEIPVHVDCTCFEGNTLVLMADGRYKPIKDVVVGDEVYTHLGRIKKVIKTGKRQVDTKKESTYSIQILGFPGKFIATGDHPFYTLRGNDVCLCGCGQDLWDGVSKDDVSKRWSPSMTLCKKFKRGHYRTTKYTKPTDRSYGTFEWIKVKDFRPREWFLSPWMEELMDKIIDPDFARLVGYYAAEGCIPGERGTEVRLTFNINEIDTLGRDVSSICDKFGMKFRIWKPNPKYGNWFNVRIMNKEFRKFCLDNISGKSLTKVFSPEVMRWNNEALKNVFIGATLGDGWLDPDKGSVKYMSSSSDLVYQLSVVLSRLKIRHTISMASKVSNKNLMYQLIVPNGRSAKSVREWLFPYLRNKDKFDSDFPELHCSDHDRKEGQLRAFRSCDKVNFDGDVYDLTVEDDGSFIVHGVAVHNCPDYMYRWSYNNAQVNAGKIGPDSWNKCINRAPREDLGQGLCKHLISLESYLRTKIYSDNDEKSNLFESENLYGRFQKFVNENKEFDVAYSSDEPVNEGFRKNKDWFIYDGVNEIKVVFNDGRQLSLAIDYKNNFGEMRDPWRRKAVSMWKKIAKEMYDSSDITEVGNVRQKPWYDCFKEAIKTKEMAPFQHPKNASKITFEKKKVTGYQNAPKIVSGVDPINFTPRV